jgi:hypothetical protein
LDDVEALATMLDISSQTKNEIKTRGDRKASKSKKTYRNHANLFEKHSFRVHMCVLKQQIENFVEVRRLFGVLMIVCEVK